MFSRIASVINNLSSPAKVVLNWGLFFTITVFIAGLMFTDISLLPAMAPTTLHKYGSEVLAYSRTLLLTTLFAVAVFEYSFQ